MGRESNAAGASASAAAAPVAVPPEAVQHLENRSFGPLPETLPPPVPASHTVEVRFLRRWRNFQAGERGNFVPSIAEQLVAVGYGEAHGLLRAHSRTMLVRK